MFRVLVQMSQLWSRFWWREPMPRSTRCAIVIPQVTPTQHRPFRWSLIVLCKLCAVVVIRPLSFCDTPVAGGVSLLLTMGIIIDNNNNNGYSLYSAILHKKWTHCALHIHRASDGALGRVVNFEACCQWELLSVQIVRHYPTISNDCTEVQSFILLSVKGMLGLFTFP